MSTPIKFAAVVALGLALLSAWLLRERPSTRLEPLAVVPTPTRSVHTSLRGSIVHGASAGGIVDAGGERVSGIVEDASGGIVAGAEVLVVSAHDEDDVIAGELSDEAGRFDIPTPSGHVRLLAGADGYAPTSMESFAPSRSLRLILAPGGILAGRVIEAVTKRPIAGIRVTAQKRSGGLESASEPTDADGAFRLSVSPGGYELWALDESWRSGSEFAVAELGRSSQPILLEVFRTGRIEGIIQVESEPCTQGALQLSGPVATRAKTDAYGVVRVGGLISGRYELSVHCPGAETLEQAFELSSANVVQRQWNLLRGLSIHGRVTTPDGLPAKDEAVTVARADATRQLVTPFSTQCVSGVDGTFHCSGLQPGVHRCFIRGEQGLRSNAVIVSVEGTNDEPIELQLLPTASIRVHVTSADGQPVDRLEVIARHGDTDAGTAQAVGPGDYLLQSLPLGIYEVRVGRNNEGGPRASARLDRHGDAVTVHLPAQAASESIIGRVLDKRDWPVSGAWIRIVAVSSPTPEAAGGYVPTTSDSDGRFTVTGVFSGSYNVLATTSTGSGEATEVEPGRPVEVRIQDFGEISGITQNANGERVATFRLIALGPDGVAAPRRVFDPDGAWRLPWVAPGTWRITAEHDGSRAVQVVTVHPGQLVHVRLTLGAKSAVRHDGDR